MSYEGINQAKLREATARSDAYALREIYSDYCDPLTSFAKQQAVERSARLAADTERFLARGGEITEVEPGATGTELGVTREVGNGRQVDREIRLGIERRNRIRKEAAEKAGRTRSVGHANRD